MKMLHQLDKPIILSYQHLAPNSDASICKTTILPLMQNGLSTVYSLSRKRWKLMTSIQNQVKQKGKRRIWVKFWKLKAMGVNGMRQVEEGGKAKHRYKSGPMSRIFVILLGRGPIESLNMNSDGHFLFGSEDFWAICIMNLTREAFVSGSINGKAGSRFALLTRLTPRSFPLPLPVFCASRGKFSG